MSQLQGVAKINSLVFVCPCMTDMIDFVMQSYLYRICSQVSFLQGEKKSHPSKLPVSCEICGKQLSNRSVLQKHIQLRHKEGKEKTVCDLCSKDCSNIELLREHRLQMHQSGKNGKFKLCLYCEYKIEGWVQLKCHIDANHPEHGKKKHLCDLCGKGFIFEASCRVHKRDQHQKIVCQFCGKKFKHGYKYLLSEHVVLEHNTNPAATTNLVCEICGYSTPSKSKLNNHIRIRHEVEKYKKCPYCEYSTPSLQKIQVHIDGKHPEHDKKQYFCDHCSRGYIFENSLKKHLENLRTMAMNKAKKEKKTLI